MKTQTEHIDPVCGMVVGAADGAVSASMHGTVYYFCAQTCRERFTADPQKYLKENIPKRKGFWRRYLDRLNKTTGGKPPSCCH